MSLPYSGKRLLAYGRDLLYNSFFWIGVGILVLLGALLYFSVDRLVMPSYTQHGTTIEIPDLRDQPVETARAELENLGLRVEEQEGQYNPNVAQDIVVDQSPLPNTPVKPERRVYLTLNRGETPTVVLPDLTGTSQREARNRVEGRGLVIEEVAPDSIPSPYPNTITRQSPSPGDTVDVGSRVSLWYSTGLSDENATVPNLVGLSVEDARATLLEHKLRPIVIRSQDEEEDRTDAEGQSEDDLYVRDQSQDPDAIVKAGTEIRLYTTSDPDRIPDSEDLDTEDSSSNDAPAMEAHSGDSTSEY